MQDHGIPDWRDRQFSGEEKPDDVIKILTVACPCCGLAQPWSHVSLDFGMCKNLLFIARHLKTEKVSYREDKFNSGSTMQTEIVHDCFQVAHYRELANSHSGYTKIGKLKWWGFLHQETRWNHNGIYQFTKRGADFLRSKLLVPKSQIIWEDHGHVAWKCARKVGFQEACQKKFTEVAEYLEDWLGKSSGRWQDGELF